MTTITIRLDKDVKKHAQELFGALGMDLTTAITLFLKQAIRNRSIPFEITLGSMDIETGEIEGRTVGKAERTDSASKWLEEGRALDTPRSS